MKKQYLWLMLLCCCINMKYSLAQASAPKDDTLSSNIKLIASPLELFNLFSPAYVVGLEYQWNEKHGILIEGGVVRPWIEEWSLSACDKNVKGYKIKLESRYYSNPWLISKGKKILGVQLGYNHIYFRRTAYIRVGSPAARFRNVRYRTVHQTAYLNFVMGNTFPIGERFSLEIVKGAGLRWIVHKDVGLPNEEIFDHEVILGRDVGEEFSFPFYSFYLGLRVAYHL